VHNKLIIVVAQNLEKNKRWSAHDGMRESRESIKLDLNYQCPLTSYITIKKN
jgi:hypothetical protein